MFDDWAVLCSSLDALHAQHPITCVIQGEAKGADFLGRVWAKYRGILFESYPADWNTHKRAAGSIRNQQMLDEGAPEYVVAFPGGSGTADMIGRARNANLPTWEI